MTATHGANPGVCSTPGETVSARANLATDEWASLALTGREVPFSSNDQNLWMVLGGVT